MSPLKWTFYLALIGATSGLADAQGRVDLVQPRISKTDLAKLRAVCEKHNLPLTLKSLRPGTALYCIVIPIDVRASRGHSHDQVTVRTMFLKTSSRNPVGGFDRKSGVRIAAALPWHVDRPVDNEFWAKVSAAAKELGIQLGFESSYTTFCRTLEVHHTKDEGVEWKFRSFKGEPVQPGTHYLVVFAEIPINVPQIKHQGRRFNVERFCSVQTFCRVREHGLFGGTVNGRGAQKLIRLANQTLLSRVAGIVVDSGSGRPLGATRIGYGTPFRQIAVSSASGHFRGQIPISPLDKSVRLQVFRRDNRGIGFWTDEHIAVGVDRRNLRLTVPLLTVPQKR